MYRVQEVDKGLILFPVLKQDFIASGHCFRSQRPQCYRVRRSQLVKTIPNDKDETQVSTPVGLMNPLGSYFKRHA